jgi:hypothetical protein
MDNPEKLATYGTQVEEKQNKNTTQKKRERKTIYDVFKLYITPKVQAPFGVSLLQGNTKGIVHS